MKKYRICFYLFLAVSAVCFAVGYAVVRYEKHADTGQSAESAVVTEAVSETREAANQEQVSHSLQDARAYYLVSENGFLLIFSREQEEACLYTHVPIMEFPESEQERLREGIWFPTMMEVFQYLESYTS